MTETIVNVTETPDAKETKVAKAKDFTAYASKTPTSLHVHYAEWLQEKTGITFPEGTDVAKITQLAVSLYHDYQASDENKARRAAEQANKAPKAVSKAKQQLTAAQQEIENLKAQLAAAKATPTAKPATVRKTATKATPASK